MVSVKFLYFPRFWYRDTCTCILKKGKIQSKNGQKYRDLLNCQTTWVRNGCKISSAYCIHIRTYHYPKYKVILSFELLCSFVLIQVNIESIILQMSCHTPGTQGLRTVSRMQSIKTFNCNDDNNDDDDKILQIIHTFLEFNIGHSRSQWICPLYSWNSIQHHSKRGKWIKLRPFVFCIYSVYSNRNILFQNQIKIQFYTPGYFNFVQKTCWW